MIVETSFYPKYVHPLPDDTVPHQIQQNLKFFSYFCKARASRDGSHFDLWIPNATLSSRDRDQKGGTTQNTLAAYDWDLRFTYILPGWEDSAANSWVYKDARANQDLHIAPGTYLVADAGFSSCDELLVPYREVHYHLKEWAQGNQRPQTKEELYNLRHAIFCNPIEQVFGITKRKFCILTAATEFGISTQAKIICAYLAPHNFICVHNRSEEEQAMAQADLMGRVAARGGKFDGDMLLNPLGSRFLQC